MNADERKLEIGLSAPVVSAVEGLFALAQQNQRVHPTPMCEVPSEEGGNERAKVHPIQSSKRELCCYDDRRNKLDPYAYDKTHVYDDSGAAIHERAAALPDHALHLKVDDSMYPPGDTRGLGDRRLHWTFDIRYEDRKLELYAYAQLELAVQLIEPMEKADYLEALRIAPHLVMIESNPGKFLLHASFNAEAAAQGIVRYWKRRREVFRERAFLPMTMTGDGALTQDAIDFIRCGQATFLPSDSCGRTVLFIQPCRRAEDNLEMRLKESFYHGQLLAENSMSQKDGYIMIATISDTYYDPYMTECKNLVMNTFPIKSYSWHVLKLLASLNHNRYLDGFVDRVVKMHSHLFRGYRTYIHPMQKKSEMLDALTSHGFKKENLPYCVGGTWEYSDFSLWIRDRIQYEREIYAGWKRNAHENTGATVSGSRIVLPLARVGDSPKLNNPISSMPESRVEFEHQIYQEHDRQPCDTETNSLQQTCNATVEITCDYLQYSRLMLSKSIKLLRPSEKAAYLEALKKAPSGVTSTESHPDLFLRTESYHPLHAAKRCARYWQLRAETLGPTKHDYLYQTGEHALGRKDLALLQSGFSRLLPNDFEGSPALSIDTTLLPKGVLDVNIKRCLFYMFSLLPENRLSQLRGVVLLIRTSHHVLVHLNLDFIVRMYHALPLRFKAIHLISPDESARTVASRLYLYDDVFVHADMTTPGQVAKELEAHGCFRASDLPDGLGGQWDLHKFHRWQELRTRVEWRVPLGLGPAEIEEALTFPGIREVPVLPESEKQERARRLNVIHSRRKRSRKRSRNDALEDEHDQLLFQHQQLVQEQGRLERLLKAALEFIFAEDTSHKE